MEPSQTQPIEVERQSMDVDIACVGFGPAMGGFLTTLSRALTNEDGTPVVESRAMPGMPPQVICYERADDIGFGVSGVVTRARGIRASFPDLDPSQIPMAAAVKEEKVAYLLDPVGASRRPFTLKAGDVVLRGLGLAKNYAFELPWAPSFLHKKDGFIFSIGQFNQWVGGQLLASGAVQIWPATPVSEPLIERVEACAPEDISFALRAHRVTGVRLVDQGVDKAGNPGGAFMPGMDIHAALTVVGDGPVGAVGRRIDEVIGMPDDNDRHEWAVGMKFVVDLPADCRLEAGTVFHTFGYPEPEIFGFLYVHPDRVASVGIFVPSWFDSPARTAYRYLQHYILHPYIWQHLKGGTLRSWGAKSLQESGRRGEPFLAGNGFARIGEGSGSTNVLTGSGVDEAWTTGVQLGEAVLELLKAGEEFTRENLERVYVARRRSSWVEKEGRVAEKARDGFENSFIQGMLGMALSGLTSGAINIPGQPRPTYARGAAFDQFYQGRITPPELSVLRANCRAKNLPFHDALMDRMGWPAVAFDGQLLITHQDALLMGGKVQAPDGYADHVVFRDPLVCKQCDNRLCIEICSGQAITEGEGDTPAFDREKCIHCGACLWNCTQAEHGHTNLEVRAGAGGLHSSEN